MKIDGINPLSAALAKTALQGSNLLYSLSCRFRGAADSISKKARIALPDLQDPEKKYKTAIHEAGHAVLTTVLPGAGQVLTMNIFGDGKYGGFVGHETEDMAHSSKPEIMSVIAVTFGGLIAEEIKYGKGAYGPGVMHDLEQATELAQDMVDKFGMSELGTITFNHSQSVQPKILGLTLPFSWVIHNEPHHSEELKIKRERAISSILDDAKKIAHDTLTLHWPAVEALAKEGLEKRVLTGDEVRAIVRTNSPVASTPSVEA